MGGVGGFGNAPFSKGLLFASVGTSVFLQAARASRRKLPRVLGFLCRSLAFQHPGELLFGAYLLYQFRVLERHAGTAKWAAHAAAVTGISLALQAAVTRLPVMLISAVRGVSAEAPAAAAAGLHVSDMYGLVFACFVQFFFDVPATSQFSLLGWRLSDKSFLYLAGVQLLTNGRAAVLSSVTGVVAGLMYRSDVAGLKRWRFPGFISRFFSRTLGPLLQEVQSGPQVLQPGGPFHQAPPQVRGQQQHQPQQHRRPGQHRNRTGAGGTAPLPGAAAAGGAANEWMREAAMGGMTPEQAAQFFGRGEYGAPAGAPPPPSAPQQPPSEEAIAQLEGMGFGRALAEQALQQSGNDVQEAIALLVS